MSNLINIFIEPGKAFADLKDKPTFLLPFLVSTLLAVGFATAYLLTVDPAWYMDQQVAAMIERGSTPAEIEQAKQFIPGARTSAWFAGPIALIFSGIVYLIYAVYYLLAGKVTGNAISFRQGLSLTAWSSLPLALGSVVALVALFTSSNQVSMESLGLLNLEPLLGKFEGGWSTLARSFSLLNVWAWFLAALGWKTWGRTGWGQAFAVVLLPSVVVYGVIALFAFAF